MKSRDMLQTCLQQFLPILLSEMDTVKLMDRVDEKFLIPMSLLNDILTEANPFYKILEINNNRTNTYKTLYFDTPDLKLYHAHQSKRLNRYKLRYRNYVESQLAYFEIKHKNNKGRTIKTRIKNQIEVRNEIFGKNGEFLESSTPLNASDFKGVLWVNYSRITLVSKTSTERLTIDVNLTFINDEKEVSYTKFAVAEVKQNRLGTSVFKDLMRKHDIREGSISKYCLGIISLNEDVKHNNFKLKLRRIKELQK